MQNTPQSILKIENKTAIISDILNHGAVSKAELAEKLKSTKTTISKNANELIEQNVLVETGKGSNTLGKKSTLLNINPNLFNFMVIDLSGNSFSLNIFNLQNTALFSKKIEIPSTDEIIKMIDKKICSCSSKLLLKKMVLSIPAGFNKNQIITENRRHIDIYNKIHDYCIENSIDLLVHNNIDLQAEYINANNFNNNKNFILIGANYGIGSSIFYNGALITGSNRFAGEIGFANPRFINGKVENLESRCSVSGILKRYYKKENIELSKGELKKEISFGNELLNKFVDEMIEELSNIILNMVFILDIDTIFISGELFELRDDITFKIEEQIVKYTENKVTVKQLSFFNNKSIEGSFNIIKREILKMID